MSEYQCQEPGCHFHIGIAGDLVTDQDFEQQDYYDQEVEEHYQMHEEHKRVSRGERVEQVAAGKLTPEHIGSQVRVLGEDLELLWIGADSTNGHERVSLTLHRWVGNSAGPVPEELSWDVPASAVIDLVIAPKQLSGGGEGSVSQRNPEEDAAAISKRLRSRLLALDFVDDLAQFGAKKTVALKLLASCAALTLVAWVAPLPMRLPSILLSMVLAFVVSERERRRARRIADFAGGLADDAASRDALHFAKEVRQPGGRCG